MNPELAAALRKLIKHIELDQPSGLQSRETLRAKNELRILLSRYGVRVDP